MLRSFKALRGFAIRATDGRIGTVSDLYFDDSSWRLSYCVVEPDGWFAGRCVLIGARSLSVLDSQRRELWVRLAKTEVRRSRTVDSAKPVSRQQRASVMKYIRRLARWSSTDDVRATTALPDAHLRSCNAIIGHRLTARDGAVGRVDDFLIDDKGWMGRELVVDTANRHLSAAARVLIAAPQVGAISWPDASVSVGLSPDAVLAAPLYTPMSSEARLCG